MDFTDFNNWRGYIDGIIVFFLLFLKIPLSIILKRFYTIGNMIIKRIFLLLTLLAMVLLFGLESAESAVYKTPNFVVTTSDGDLARLFAETAEKQRRELAIAWLGAPLRDWSQPCKISVTVNDKLSPGGATTFVFSNGEVYGWDMNIQGSAQRVVDSVLPHEITHMIFACRFRQPVPRWADEGAATSVEHLSEKNKYRNMLIEFLQTNRGIAFRSMVNAKEYPPDAMPFYAQSFTAAEYLIARGGRRQYVEFVQEGIDTDDWGGALKHHYGYKNLGEFQNIWLTWVAARFPQIESDRKAQILIAGTAPSVQADFDGFARVARPEPNLVLRTPVSTAHPNSVASTYVPASVGVSVASANNSLPRPSGVWQEVTPASYNEIQPDPAAAVPFAPIPDSKETPSASAQKGRLNWLPGDSLPLYDSPKTIQR